MTCPRCGAEARPGARFCSRCGLRLAQGPPPARSEGPPTEPIPRATPPPPAEPPPPPPSPGAPPPDPRGWWVAAARGTLAFVVVGLLALAVAVLITLDADVSVTDTVKAGGLTFFGFHHAGIRVDLPPLDFGGLERLVPQPPPTDVPGVDGLEGLSGIEVGGSLAVALLLATAAAAWLLYRGGKAAATAGGGPLPARLVVGASVAAPYAVLSLILALLVSFTFRVPAAPFAGAGGVRVGPSASSGFLWPLVLGVVFGGLGGTSSAAREPAAPGWLAAVLRGAALMLLVTAALAFLGLFVLSAANPEAFRGYFRALGEADTMGAVLQVLFTALLVPNLMVALVFLGMGSNVVVGDYVGGTAFELLSLGRFPRGFDPGALVGPEGLDPIRSAASGALPGLDFGTAPPEYFFFILPPLLAVIVGGMAAARRGRAGSPGGGAALGAAAGLAFGVGLTLLGVLAGVGFRFEVSLGLRQSTLGHLGPNVLTPIWPGGFLLALAWGGLGGALGGLLGARGGTPAPTREASGG